MGMGDFKMGYGDIETGFGQTAVLYPGIGAEENELRWGFIRKVYGILSVQLVLTTIVAGFVVLSEPVKEFFQRTPGVVLLLAILPLILLCPLYAYHESHPVNLILLGLFTVAISLSVGISCSFAPAPIVLEALILTAVVVVSLTGYTYWAAKNGQDFQFLRPILFTSLILLIFFGLIQVFFPLGQISQTIYGGISALIFCGYIVYDTDNLIKRYTYDQFIWASVALYLDVINLFLALLRILQSMQSSN